MNEVVQIVADKTINIIATMGVPGSQIVEVISSGSRVASLKRVVAAVGTGALIVTLSSTGGAHASSQHVVGRFDNESRAILTSNVDSRGAPTTSTHVIALEQTRAESAVAYTGPTPWYQRYLDIIPRSAITMPFGEGRSEPLSLEATDRVLESSPLLAEANGQRSRPGLEARR